MLRHAALNMMLSTFFVAASLAAGEQKYFGENTVGIPEDNSLECPHGSDGYIIELDTNEAKVREGNDATKLLLKKLMGKGQVIHELKSINSVAVRGLDDSVLSNLRLDKQIKKLILNCIIKIDDPEGARSYVREGNDAAAVLSWGLDRIDDRDGLDHTYNDAGFTGNGAAVYILDTGIRTKHNDFGGRAVGGWSSGCPTLGASGCTTDGGATGWVYRGDIDSATDQCHGHGTHCASTAGGKGYGVAKEVEIVTVQVLSCQGSGSNANVIGGIEWAVDDAKKRGKPAVLSMSLGGGGRKKFDEAINKAMDEGILTIVAAGNSATNACAFSPASTLSAVTVGSTEEDDSFSYYSNFGRCVDILAPGGEITAAWSSSDTAINTISGTSMATPHVAGAAAQILAADPTMSPEALTTALVECMGTPARDVIDGLTWMKFPPWNDIRMLYNDHTDSDVAACLV